MSTWSCRVVRQLNRGENGSAVSYWMAGDGHKVISYFTSLYFGIKPAFTCGAEGIVPGIIMIVKSTQIDQNRKYKPPELASLHALEPERSARLTTTKGGSNFSSLKNANTKHPHSSAIPGLTAKPVMITWQVQKLAFTE